MPRRWFELSRFGDLGLVDLHRQRDLAHTDPDHPELIATRDAFPHARRAGHPDQTVRVPMEMRAVFPLLFFLSHNLVAHSVLAAEPIPPILRQLAQRHLVR